MSGLKGAEGVLPGPDAGGVQPAGYLLLHHEYSINEFQKCWKLGIAHYREH